MPSTHGGRGDDGRPAGERQAVPERSKSGERAEGERRDGRSTEAKTERGSVGVHWERAPAR